MQDEAGELLVRIAGRDRSALQALYNCVAPKLMGILLRMLGERADAEDALQEVFLRIWERAAAFDSNKGAGLNWICAVTRNHALDRLRSRPGRRGIRMVEADEVVQLAGAERSAEAQAILRATMQEVVECFRELPTERAEAVKSAYLMGLSYQDLAARYDVPLNTMRTWLRRALISLRECLDR